MLEDHPLKISVLVKLVFSYAEEAGVFSIDRIIAHAPLDFSFFLPYNWKERRKKKETRKEGVRNVIIRESEYRV